MTKFGPNGLPGYFNQMCCEQLDAKMLDEFLRLFVCPDVFCMFDVSGLKLQEEFLTICCFDALTKTQPGSLSVFWRVVGDT